MASPSSVSSSSYSVSLSRAATLLKLWEKKLRMYNLDSETSRCASLSTSVRCQWLIEPGTARRESTNLRVCDGGLAVWIMCMFSFERSCVSACLFLSPLSALAVSPRAAGPQWSTACRSSRASGRSLARTSMNFSSFEKQCCRGVFFFHLSFICLSCRFIYLYVSLFLFSSSLFLFF